MSRSALDLMVPTFLFTAYEYFTAKRKFNDQTNSLAIPIVSRIFSSLSTPDATYPSSLFSREIKPLSLFFTNSTSTNGSAMPIGESSFQTLSNSNSTNLLSSGIKIMKLETIPSPVGLSNSTDFPSELSNATSNVFLGNEPNPVIKHLQLAKNWTCGQLGIQDTCQKAGQAAQTMLDSMKAAGIWANESIHSIYQTLLKGKDLMAFYGGPGLPLIASSSCLIIAFLCLRRSLEIKNIITLPSSPRIPVSSSPSLNEPYESAKDPYEFARPSVRESSRWDDFNPRDSYNSPRSGHSDIDKYREELHRASIRAEKYKDQSDLVFEPEVQGYISASDRMAIRNQFSNCVASRQP
jgi:hypothetical protein